MSEAAEIPVAEAPMSTTIPPMATLSSSSDTPADTPEARAARLKFAGTFDTLVQSNLGLTERVSQLVTAVKVATAIQTIVVVTIGLLVAFHR